MQITYKGESLRAGHPHSCAGRVEGATRAPTNCDRSEAEQKGPCSTLQGIDTLKERRLPIHGAQSRVTVSAGVMVVLSLSLLLFAAFPLRADDMRLPALPRLPSGDTGGEVGGIEPDSPTDATNGMAQTGDGQPARAQGATKPGAGSVLPNTHKISYSGKTNTIDNGKEALRPEERSVDYDDDDATVPEETTGPGARVKPDTLQGLQGLGCIGQLPGNRE
jgi:hypothetical protein